MLRVRGNDSANIGFPAPFFYTSRVNYVRNYGYISSETGKYLRFALPVIIYDTHPMGSNHRIDEWCFGPRVFRELRASLFEGFGMMHLPDMTIAGRSGRSDYNLRPYTLSPSPYSNDLLWMHYAVRNVPSANQSWVESVARFSPSMNLWRGSPFPSTPISVIQTPPKRLSRIELLLQEDDTYGTRLRNS